MTLNPTEAFVFHVCTKSFLSTWSYANPQGKSATRELCDILVLCDPDVILISVKEVQVKLEVDLKVRFERWVRRAIDESVRQIYGAEGWINSGKHTNVIRADGQLGLPFPESAVRRIHRIAVAIGGEEHFPVPFGDFGEGFVHVFDRRSFEIVLNELDTVTDFVEYLSAKEALFSQKQEVVVMGEENLLAVYLGNNRAFPTGADLMIIESGSWEQFVGKPEVEARNRADKISYIWDELIEFLAADILGGHVEYLSDLTNGELALRVMARESRFDRRLLSHSLAEFLRLAAEEKFDARMMPSTSGTGYVFLASSPSQDQVWRAKELALRCLVARDRLKTPVVIGLATERPGTSKGISWSIVYMNLPAWTERDAQQAAGIVKDLGYFANPEETNRHHDEYPGA